MFNQYVIDLLELACQRLLGKYNQSTSALQPMIEALATQTQDWNDITQTVFDGRDLDTAVGIQLDLLGKIIGQERPTVDGDDIPYFTWDTETISEEWDGSAGWFATNAPTAGLTPVSDGVYRQFLKGKVFKNHVSGGSIPEMMEFIKLTLDVDATIRYSDTEPLAYYVIVPSEVSDVYIKFLLGKTDNSFVENSYNIPTPMATRLIGVMPNLGPSFGFDRTDGSVSGWDTGKWTLVIPAE